MADQQAVGGGGPRRSLVPTRWAVWTLPGRVKLPVLLVELLAVALVVVGLVDSPHLPRESVVVATVLAVLGIAHTEVVAGVERIRRRVVEGNFVDLSSVWTFAAALALPGPYAAIVAVVVHCHLWWRAWRLRVPLYKQVFTSATVVLACLASSSVLAHVNGIAELAGSRGFTGLVLALLTYTVVNSCLVAGAIAVSSSGVELDKVFASWDDNLLEIATLCLGGLAAVALVINPWLVLLALPPLLVLHRAVLVRHLEKAASTDSKTGLLNAAAWHAQAEEVLRNAWGSTDPHGVLLLDLDHFKVVNDSHGHLSGDVVLAAVAAALRGEVRERDLVGRFGGEEFVVLLAGLDGGSVEDLEAVAERIRKRIAALRVSISTPDGPLTVAGLSVSVGAAVCSGEGADLQAMLQIADAALYAAKGAGRNTVRVGMAVPVQQPAMDPPAPTR